LILFAFAIALPACQGGDPASVGGSARALVAPPASCANGDPTCNVALDYPVQADLSVANSQNISFSTADNALTLSAGSGTLVDTDGDGVPDPADDCPGPGWRLPCDGDASNDGVYQTLYFDANGEVTVQANLDITGSIKSADAYVLMDSTGSMRGEQVQLITDLTTGTFVDPTQCAGGAGTGLAGALKCSVPDLWLGLGEFREIPLLPHAKPYDQTPYHHYLDLTDNLQEMIDAVSSLVVHGNKDYPEATTQAIYSVVTGKGLGPFVPNRGSFPAGRWGYPCFRPGVLPIILLFTDAEMWNGPRTASPQYTNPPFDGVLGAGVQLPPVEMSPQVLYSSDPFTAWDLGDLTNRSLTVMGANTNLGNDARTWDVGTCYRCGGSGCWADGRDAFVKFSLNAMTSPFLSGEGTYYPTANVAVFDSTLTALDCNPGPGSGDYWGRLTPTLGAGDYYLVSDAAVSPSESIADKLGGFQLRIQTTPGDSSWQTADLPILWTDVETELLATGVKFVSVISPNAAGLVGLPDATELAVVTGSVDQSGSPYLQTINGDGSGLTTALLDAVRSLVGNTRRDISIVPEDNAATVAVDETGFVTAVTATSCPTAGLNNCLGVSGAGDTCTGCLQDTQVAFEFRLGNDSVAQGATPQVFDFDMVGLADGTVELGRIPMRVMVPEAGSSYGAGFYENTYDSDVVCDLPSERPDWGMLTWSGSTPSDSTVEFEISTANTLAELDSVIPVSILYPTGTAAQAYDIGEALLAAGQFNQLPFLRIRAKLKASSDSLSTPIFEGWSMQFNCVKPF